MIIKILLVVCIHFVTLQSIGAITHIVLNTSDSGIGSLRSIVASSSDGDVINFDVTILGDTIILYSTIAIDQNITISNDGAIISIRIDTDVPAFVINEDKQVTFSGFQVLGGNNPNGSAIENYGILILVDFITSDNGRGAIESIIHNHSTGQLMIEENCKIKSDSLQGIIFETNFNLNAPYSVSNLGLWNGGSNDVTTPIAGWDGMKAIGNSTIEIVENIGVDDTHALRMSWDENLAQPTVSLGKHLTGIDTTGYEELYIRYHIKLPNNFKAGIDGSDMTYWKWGRLWQNTTIDTFSSGLIDGNWTENRVDSKYVVWNFIGRIPYTNVSAVWGANVGNNLHQGSAGGESIGIDYFVSGSVQETALGYFESLWDLNDSDRPGELEDNSCQYWHTIEYHFKLATDASSEDGIFEMWWDGVHQGGYTRIGGLGGASTPTGIPTTKDGSGFNFFVLFDNMNGWNHDWNSPDFEGYILVNDVVVSQNRIGHNYNAGNKY